jgi:hypothetical protein
LFVQQKKKIIRGDDVVVVVVAVKELGEEKETRASSCNDVVEVMPIPDTNRSNKEGGEKKVTVSHCDERKLS